MGRVIDANAMYQAGRGAGPQGVKEPIWGEYIEGLGKMVIDSTVKGFSKLNDFREKSQAQTALIDLKIDKISKDNPYLKNDILSWKVDYDKKFRELSKVARIAATLAFLKGYKVMSRQLEKRAIDTGSKAPRIIHPTSKTRGEISLLDSDIMQMYFREYNKYINSKNENTLTELLESGNESVSLVKSALRTCGG